MTFDDLIANIPVALEPIYSSSEPNATIELYRGPVGVEFENSKENCEIILYFDWSPSPGLRFKLSSLGALKIQVGQEFQIVLPSGTTLLTGQLTGIDLSFGTPPGGASSNYPASGLVINDSSSQSAATNRVFFHLANFAEYWGKQIRNTVAAWTGRAELSASGWSICIDSVRTPTEDTKKLKASGGFGITHAGSLRRENGDPFSRSDATETLRIVGLYLSFVAGRWVSPILRQGAQTDGGIWNDWLPYRTARQRVVAGWFNSRSFDLLPKAFAGFDSRLRDPRWKEPFHLAIYWYLESNACSGGVEGSIILLQAALELLAFELLVNDRRHLSEDGFSKLPAADAIRLLLASNRIPLSIPSQFRDLGAMGKGLNWADGPACLAGIRNALIHSNPKNRSKVLGKSDNALCEMWDLGLWYLDMTILNLIGFNGKYSDRRVRNGWVGQEVDVPWA